MRRRVHNAWEQSDRLPRERHFKATYAKSRIGRKERFRRVANPRRGSARPPGPCPGPCASRAEAGPVHHRGRDRERTKSLPRDGVASQLRERASRARGRASQKRSASPRRMVTKHTGTVGARPHDPVSARTRRENQDASRRRRGAPRSSRVLESRTRSRIPGGSDAAGRGRSHPAVHTHATRRVRLCHAVAMPLAGWRRGPR